MKTLKRIAASDAHHRVIVSIILAAALFLAFQGRVSMLVHFFVTWDSFSLCLLAMAWVRMLHAHPCDMPLTAKLEDSSRTAIFVFVIISACASLLALFVLLGLAKDMPKSRLTGEVVLSIATVACSWVLVHTVFALRYAHAYYPRDTATGGAIGDGLEFPDEKSPDYLDFAYFSFVIGMTCQVSDVQITSRAIRRLALVHGLVSFAFNTVILALSINIISGLL